MNWYTAIKTAMPLSEQPLTSIYDVGHCGFSGHGDCPPIEEMWYIDKQWQIFRTAVEADLSHPGAFDDFGYDDHTAHGRYQKNEDGTSVASMIIHREPNMNPRRFQYIENQVVALLEKTFGPETEIRNYDRGFAGQTQS